MKIKIGTLTINTFDSKNLKDYKFVREIGNDKEVKEYLGDNVSNTFIPKENEKGLALGRSYIVKNNDESIGFFSIESMNSEEVVINYGVHENYRNKGYGTKILCEISNFFLTITKANNIVLNIDAYNKGCIKCAKNADFKLKNVIEAGVNDAIMVYKKQR